jgi:dolichyl-phosphate beta-glucosyltransferase
VEDTQCGFKLFTRAAAARIFPVQHIERWAFDVELLFLAAGSTSIPIVVRAPRSDRGGGVFPAIRN